MGAGSSFHAAANPEKNYEAGGGEAVQKTPREVALCRARWITWRIGYRERRLLRLKLKAEMEAAKHLQRGFSGEVCRTNQKLVWDDTWDGVEVEGLPRRTGSSGERSLGGLRSERASAGA
mmetsp:Transcript_31881/g.101565  ORF Transcript_31881/g.101565 Transcript_31881/m.101565 type:complete len:120 (+) Transcript_31881:104-463(+)